jgi:hypothetical protein
MASIRNEKQKHESRVRGEEEKVWKVYPEGNVTQTECITNNNHKLQLT